MKNPAEFLRTKTENVYKLIYLASDEAYLNEINEEDSDFNIYHPRLREWLCPVAPTQSYRLVSDHDQRIGIGATSSSLGSEEEKERFSNGVFQLNSGTLIDKSKHVLATSSTNLDTFMERVLYRAPEAHPSTQHHNPAFILEGVELLSALGSRNRLKVFARVRHHFDLGEEFISCKPMGLSLGQK